MRVQVGELWLVFAGKLGVRDEDGAVRLIVDLDLAQSKAASGCEEGKRRECNEKKPSMSTSRQHCALRYAAASATYMSTSGVALTARVD